MSASNGSHAGSPKSWVAVIIILVGFTLGGVALTMGPDWTMFWIGAGICVVGGVVALAVDILSDVIVDAPRSMPSTEPASKVEPASEVGPAS